MRRRPPRPTLFPYTTLFRSIEAKDRPMSMRAIRDELREARENRCAAGAVVVFTPAHAPTGVAPFSLVGEDRKSTRLNSSHVEISYAVFCLKKKKSITLRRPT